MAARRFEYRFVQLAEDRAARERVVHEHARDGWRLVQILVPRRAPLGTPNEYELIFERERIV